MKQHRHNWKPAQCGCKENPGVFIIGNTHKMHSVCECGAKREVIESIKPTDSGQWVKITKADGTETVRDTTNW